VLKIEIDVLEIVEVRKSYRNLATRLGLEVASRVEALMRAVQSMATRFNERQQKHVSGRLHLDDGRLETLHDSIFSPLTPDSLPPGMAMMQAMVIDGAQRLPDDSDSYVVEIHDGPADYRRFWDVTMLAVYQDPSRTLTILWIGPTSDLPTVMTRLDAATGGLRNWVSMLGGTLKGWSR
jgi:hypothetical protein